jgi:hypothetical protein
MKATVTTRYPDALITKSIEVALNADNGVAPKPLRIKSEAKGKELISTISGAPDTESLLATIDDILLCLIAVERLASAAEPRERRSHRRR